jgi:putative chitinase
MVSLAQLQVLYPRAKAGHVEAIAAQSTAVFDEFGISQIPNRLHFFLAQIGHESGGLSVVEENLNYSAPRLMQIFPKRFPTLASAEAVTGSPQRIGNSIYSGRMGNGDAASGDGFRYRGRGYIQLTGKDNYRLVGAHAGIDLVGDPDRAFAAADALRVACGFWALNHLNAICDTGDFTQLTRRINGGTVGLPDRLAWLDKVRRTLSAPPSRQPPVETVRAVQRALMARGFTQVGAADGDLGEHTAGAIRLFRSRNGMADGLIDPPLLAVLGIS